MGTSKVIASLNCGLIETGNGTVAIIDLDDVERCSRLTWTMFKRPDGAPVVRGRNADGSYTYVHRMITGALCGQFVDHADGNTLNNQKDNLRICSRADNNRNKRTSAKTKSGFKGVYSVKKSTKWRACIRNPGGRSIHLGTFETREGAAKAYDERARLLHGRFACVNFPNEGERSAHFGGDF